MLSVDDVIKYEEERTQFMKRHGAILEQINYQKALITMLDVLKLLCFHFYREIDYILIDENTKEFIKRTHKEIIEKGCDA